MASALLLQDGDRAQASNAINPLPNTLYERKVQTSETLIEVAVTRVLLRRLARL
jgi:hypothetical protein